LAAKNQKKNQNTLRRTNAAENGIFIGKNWLCVQSREDQRFGQKMLETHLS
jgi:hypothetical protein